MIVVWYKHTMLPSSLTECPPDGMKVSRSTVRDQAVIKLRSAIISGRLQPGQRLIEKDLCELVGVSRTSLREALRQLEGERLVHAPPHKGPSVAVPTPEAAAQIYQVRSVLERLAGSEAAIHATPEHVARLNRSVAAFAEAVSRQDPSSLVRLANEFYDVLLEASRHQVVADMLKSLHARISFLRATSMSTPGRPPQSLLEMRAIARAVARKDPKAAGAACARHVELAARAAFKRLAIKSPTRRGEKAVAA